MATEIKNDTSGIVSLPLAASGVMLSPGQGVVVDLTEAEAITALGGSLPAGLRLRLVGDNQDLTPVP